MTPIQVVGIGLDGREGLSPKLLQLIDQAAVLVGSPRHLSYFPDGLAQTWVLGDLKATLDRLRQRLDAAKPGIAVVLASGDPLFFGLGRLLLDHLPAESLTFHPHLSAVQLAFSRLKLPWQGATLISAHGRSTEELTTALRRGDALIAVLTDPTHNPAVLGQLILSLGLPYSYRLTVCENLGDDTETIHHLTPETTVGKTFAALNVVVLQRHHAEGLNTENLPLIGLPDRAFATFSDRPGLITKRDIRIQILADLDPKPGQVIWDVGAGTGSVSVEINRLCPTAQAYAIEKTAAGHGLIQQNQRRLGNANLHPIYGAAPEALSNLPDPDRIFIGGSGGHLTEILDLSAQRLRPQGRIVLALATLEHTSTVLTWASRTADGRAAWSVELRQIQVQQGVHVGALTRWQPLTPITIVTLNRP
ncbi:MULTISPECIES: precorrin-6y C5,15-methyltransferase (decarboxylating) subunit CbiE [Cyanophyceae]|uniref:precorrin-6y C5,15-methyltransferase (decarboxylating) subunit CbiE n=1 Tax=Cyanophyceae TaxID=3028117 RepID=UPI0016886BFC|nr:MULTISPECIES: precorrin-6y C5,15-methyltransferase (decarboxylating) subunit CbiE [Cyanophyceae]MBD1914799.1 precorrin-6y C5,15-methyltransferase (decarboxylating) subunit CbiE [Phormidium sp. FACHB-77]MBD2030902.1 precorrin-6y C5,15-methyltransferase (decarboxylating) subunit CbiE [Phormidium sp. FACHB-322]MBD2052500.1 precorrin-6y C5,15-methyltransferase (decarboxylating) subunit CbiE [Leptolyngbya sp. FACHB-60]